MAAEAEVERYAQVAAGEGNVPIYAHRVVARDILDALEADGRLVCSGEPVVFTGKTQLVVTHADHQITYHQVGPERGWKIDAASRCIVIGKFPRTYIPLDRVLSFDIEEVS